MINYGKIPFKKVCKRCGNLYLPTGKHSEKCPDCIKEIRQLAIMKGVSTRGGLL